MLGSRLKNPRRQEVPGYKRSWGTFAGGKCMVPKASAEGCVRRDWKGWAGIERVAGRTMYVAVYSTIRGAFILVYHCFVSSLGQIEKFPPIPPSQHHHLPFSIPNWYWFPCAYAFHTLTFPETIIFERDKQWYYKGFSWTTAVYRRCCHASRLFAAVWQKDSLFF